MVLTRGLTSNMDAWKWVKDVLDGDPSKYRKNGTVSLYNQQKEKVAAYDITAAWPTSVVTSGSATGGTDAVMESITITHEGFKRTT
jgi:phage tail-like protein